MGLAYPKSSASDLEGSPSSSEETPESPASFTGDDVPNRRIRFLRLLNGVGFVCDADAASVSVWSPRASTEPEGSGVLLQEPKYVAEKTCQDQFEFVLSFTYDIDGRLCVVLVLKMAHLSCAAWSCWAAGWWSGWGSPGCCRPDRRPPARAQSEWSLASAGRRRRNRRGMLLLRTFIYVDFPETFAFGLEEVSERDGSNFSTWLRV